MSFRNDKYIKRYLQGFNRLNLQLRRFLLVALSTICFTLSPLLSRGADIRQREIQLDVCIEKVKKYNLEKGTRDYTDEELNELLRCIELIEQAAKQKVEQPTTIFKQQTVE